MTGDGTLVTAIEHDNEALREEGRQQAFKEAIAICEGVSAHWQTFHSVAPAAAEDCATRIKVRAGMVTT